jgi:hypothetical protein
VGGWVGGCGCGCVGVCGCGCGGGGGQLQRPFQPPQLQQDGRSAHGKEQQRSATRPHQLAPAPSRGCSAHRAALALHGWGGRWRKLRVHHSDDVRAVWLVIFVLVDCDDARGVRLGPPAARPRAWRVWLWPPHVSRRTAARVSCLAPLSLGQGRRQCSMGPRGGLVPLLCACGPGAGAGRGPSGGRRCEGAGSTLRRGRHPGRTGGCVMCNKRGCAAAGHAALPISRTAAHGCRAWAGAHARPRRRRLGAGRLRPGGIGCDAMA